MRDEITTTDLSKFGRIELDMIIELLQAWKEQDLPDDFDDDGITIMFNTHSGCVFLTNTEYQVAMMNGEKLERWYNCPNCGHEGFKEDMKHEPEDNDCTRYMQELGIIPKEEEEG